MKDPEFIAFTKSANLDVEPSTGEQTAAFLAQAYGASSATIDAARKLLQEP